MLHCGFSVKVTCGIMQQRQGEKLTQIISSRLHLPHCYLDYGVEKNQTCIFTNQGFEIRSTVLLIAWPADVNHDA